MKYEPITPNLYEYLSGLLNWPEPYTPEQLKEAQDRMSKAVKSDPRLQKFLRDLENNPPNIHE